MAGAYTIRTRDGITIPNVPDNIKPDSAEARRLVTAERERLRALGQGPTPRAPVAAPTPEPETTFGGVLAAANRALAPYAAGAGAGALVGSPFAGVGAVPGALAGVGAVGLSKTVGDPLVSMANTYLGTNFETPTQTLEHLMDKLGMPRPQTATERTVQSLVEAGAGAGAQAKLGQLLQGSGFGATAQGVGRALAAEPVAQVVGGAAAGGASQATAEAGGGPGEQLVAALLAGGLGVKGTQMTQAAMRPKAPGVRIAEPLPPGEPTAPATAPIAEATESYQNIGKLTKMASGGGARAKVAQAKLAEAAAVNPEAKAAAEKLGFDLPPDVFSDSPQIRAAVGLTRSVVGSEAESSWRTTVASAVDQADEVMKNMDAQFVEGAVSPAVVSEKVRKSLLDTRARMNQEAVKVYDAVNEQVPKAANVTAPNTKNVLEAVKAEVGETGLSSAERRLARMVNGDEAVTYGRLMREKSLIGQAIAGKASPYGSMEEGALKRLYGALAEDQLDAVGALAGEETRQQLRAANLLYAKERALGKRIVAAFGTEQDGSLATLMRNAISSGAKGGNKEFTQLMKLVPRELQRETLATALASATRGSRGGGAAGFGFSEYVKTYQGLRANPEMYKTTVDVLGPGSHEILKDLYGVAKRVTDARANVLTTGKANQALVGALTAENMVANVLEKTSARTAAAVAGSTVGGPVGAGLATALTNMLSNPNRNAVTAAGKLFMSDEWKKAVMEATTRTTVNPSSIRRLSVTPQFKAFANAAKLPMGDEARFNWLMNATRGQQATKENTK